MYLIVANDSLNVAADSTRPGVCFLGNHTSSETRLEVIRHADGQVALKLACTFAEFDAWLQAGKPMMHEPAPPAAPTVRPYQEDPSTVISPGVEY